MPFLKGGHFYDSLFAFASLNTIFFFFFFFFQNTRIYSKRIELASHASKFFPF